MHQVVGEGVHDTDTEDSKEDIHERVVVSMLRDFFQVQFVLVCNQFVDVLLLQQLELCLGIRELIGLGIKSSVYPSHVKIVAPISSNNEISTFALAITKSRGICKF